MSALNILWRALAAAVLLAALDAQAVVATIYPASPVAGEPFILRVSGSTGNGPDNVTSQNVTVNGSNIAVNLQVHVEGFSAGGSYMTSVVVPGLAAGGYQYVVSAQYDDQESTSQATGTITVTQSSGPATPFSQTLSANWFSDDEAGWGINIVQGASGQLFAIWATYRPSCGNGSQAGPLWLVMSDGRWESPTLFRGLLYVTGGSPAEMPWDPTQAGIEPIGALSLQFVDNDHVNVDGELPFVCAGVSKTKTLHRLKF